MLTFGTYSPTPGLSDSPTPRLPRVSDSPTPRLPRLKQGFKQTNAKKQGTQTGNNHIQQHPFLSYLFTDFNAAHHATNKNLLLPRCISDNNTFPHACANTPWPAPNLRNVHSQRDTAPLRSAADAERFQYSNKTT